MNKEWGLESQGGKQGMTGLRDAEIDGREEKV